MFNIIPKPSKTQKQLVSYKLKFNGNFLDDDIKVHGIEVDKQINKISRAKVSIFGGDVNLKTFDVSEKTDFKPGNKVEIQIGYDNANYKVFEGIINKQKISLLNGYRSNRSKSLLVLDCVDKAIKLTNSYTTDIYVDDSDSDIIKSIITKSGITKTVETTFLKHSFFPKHNSNDWDFILDRSRLNGMVIINSDNEIDIKDPYSSSTFAIPELLIEHGDATINFDAQVDSSYQYNSLEYCSWDPYNEKSLNSISQEPDLNIPGNIKHSEIKDVASPTKTSIMFSQPISANELKELAKSKFLQSRLSSHCGYITVKGVNKIKLSSLIKLNGFGKTFDGIVYVSSVFQKLYEGIYTTKIGFGIKRDFFKSNLIINKNEVIDQIHGLHIGTVKQIDQDPENEYRIKVNIPSLKLTGDGIWSRLTHFYTSVKSGSFFIPEIGSQVVVSFISNDSRFPVVLGGLYTKKNQPYSKIEKENNKKAIVSRENLTIELDDKDKTINILTSNKNKISIVEKDKSEGIKIIDFNDNIIETSKDGISLKSKKDISIHSDGIFKLNAKKGVQFKSDKDIIIDGSNINNKAKSKFSSKCASVDLNSSGIIKIKGSSVSLN
jgi:phage protein D